MSRVPTVPRDDRMLVIFCGTQFPEAPRAIRGKLRRFADVEVCAEEDVDAAIGRADVLIPAMVRIHDRHLERARRLRLIQQFATGVEGVDLAGASARGIPVCNIPAGETGNASAVAEIALLHLVALLRRYREAAENVQRGWLGVPVGRGLAGKRVVVLGLGAVGTEVVRRLVAYDASVVCVSRRGQTDGLATARALGAQGYLPLEELAAALAGADALVICLRYSAEHANLVSRKELAAMNPRGVVVNVARGGLLDHDAICEALDSGHLVGAGLDVYWEEPPDARDRFFKHETSTTPHIGAVTEEVYGRMADVVADNLERLRSGAPLRYRVV